MPDNCAGMTTAEMAWLNFPPLFVWCFLELALYTGRWHGAGMNFGNGMAAGMIYGRGPFHICART
jgi:hypothetical protein